MTPNQALQQTAGLDSFLGLQAHDAPPLLSLVVPPPTLAANSRRIKMTTRKDSRSTDDWRRLRFNSIEDCVAEVRRIVAADQEGQLRATGNWTPGQAMAHVASWIEYAYEGFPIRRPPFFIRWMLRLRLKKMLDAGMPRGVRIPGVKSGTTGIDDMETVDAANRLLAALDRLGTSENATYDSPAFGPMSQEDRIKLNLRHAELHLGYLSY